MNFPQKKRLYDALKRELELTEGYLKSNEAIYLADTMRYNQFKGEHTRRKEELLRKIEELG